MAAEFSSSCHLLTWLIQLLSTSLYWVTMSNGHTGRALAKLGA